MNIGLVGEDTPLDRRVILTPPVVRHLVEQGHRVWVQSGAGLGAMFRDSEYIRAGADIGYSQAEVIHRSEVLVRISVPNSQQIELCEPGTAVLAFYHMAVVGRGTLERLMERGITAIGCELISTEDGRRPVLKAASEIAGPMTIHLAAHLLRSSSGGRGILLGGSPGVPPAHVVILGAGAVGTCAARSARAAGARVTVLDTDAEKLRRIMEHLPSVSTAFAEPESIAAAVASADVLIGAILVVGAKTPHLVTRAMVESMNSGSVIIDVSIDQGGCVETSRPTTLAEPTFTYHDVVHYCVPNLTADMGRSTSTALAQALLPYLSRLARDGIAGALRDCPDLARGVYLYRGCCTNAALAASRKLPCRPLEELLAAPGDAA